ncbi:Mitochondrial dicarboxylate transporter [Elasticomyces elasticus]|uniref:Mitochondrial dicarboxylate transporter n=1 Tax=Exophiala sideris TaxID=1016849 RepID=A0ABR0JRQ4_9EURO|nr:Mitochondrial dicarboxylate transporter [Elasticomyces elasticus]KAK5040260.1 Mitochondrial dicarboxylate transporter [Exophiala sideris]KAK5043314.1 Mitochondrial dicarboxylate transporter [Exophiala sideris]KAK5068638.1 Mitochondrial dicarboxylate transporter [Exophiala sideris]KAK5186236.1 Mitochondrial dicarboxylate transporter [Eurotiomycetes sp. CCFEE 6388]
MSNAPSPIAKVNVEAQPKSKPAVVHYPFWFGGSAASMAAVVTHPLDLIKVRLQTRLPDAPKSTLGTAAYVYRNQGITGLYAGLSAALLRQMTYSTVRFGVYEDLKERFAPQPTPDNPKPKHSLLNLVLMSSAAGFLGGIAGNPADVLNVRMQSDASKPPEVRRNYKHALDGLVRMIREEGFASIFRGVEANSTRALLMTASQLASYDVFKQVCLRDLGMSDNFLTHFTASLAAGFVATTLCSPVDVIKTRVMSAGGKSSILQLLSEASRKEGPLWIFRGWVPSFIRLGPQTICTMVFFEQHKKLYRSWKGIEDQPLT